ncbi:MAG: Fic family protein [Actinomycetota bacterium]|nr:Fic family protein [Actinomycetota bacterium]
MNGPSSEYRLIEDLPASWESLEVSELRALDQVWQEQRERLETLDELKRFRTEIIRSWAIETGVIERVYAIDRGTTEILIERGIEESLLVGGTDRDPTEVMAVLRDHHETAEGLFDFVARRRDLSASYIKELHQVLTRNQPTSKAIDQFGRVFDRVLLRGDWKRVSNNPTRENGTVHAYCPPEHVASEMDRLIAMHLAHSSIGVPPEIEAAWLHHRFAQIHPFQDGNGRVARALASLVYIRARWFPLSIHRDRKAEYIAALERADDGDLEPLSALFGVTAKDALVRALAVGDRAEQDLRGIHAVVSAARDRMLGTAPGVDPKTFERAKETSERLLKAGGAQLAQVKQVINQEISLARPNFSVNVDIALHGDARARWYRATQIRIAKEDLHYFANLKAYNGWTRLRLNDFDEGSRHEVVVCLHAMGQTFRGLIAGVAFFERADRDEDSERFAITEQCLVADLFQVNHIEDAAVAERRFCDWLQRATTVGLGIWERGMGGSEAP